MKPVELLPDEWPDREVGILQSVAGRVDSNLTDTGGRDLNEDHRVLLIR